MLLDLLLVLAAAKIAAEVAERLRLPAVLAEILAGVVLGPSVLGAVGSGEVLRFLAELGVVLLLLEVGLEMDLGELGAVGRASVLVAVAGVALPFVGGFVVASALGEAVHPAIFVAGALTATSVGITARVFADLRALSSVEARTVLGAAVADDVLGLVILTVVVRVVSAGNVSVASVGVLIAGAVAFLVVAGGVGVQFAPRIFATIDRHSRSTGTLLAAALVFTFGLGELAGVAKLAPIIGAFVAGISLAKAKQAERVRRDLNPVGQVLIPVFFVQIGLDADLASLMRPSVVALAGALLVVAVVGKVASAAAAVGSPGDRWLIGLGMLPRGEVGLIFAGLGLREGILGGDLYAALLLVILATTLATPPLLKWRLRAVSAARRAAPGRARPEGGWFDIADGEVELRGRPGLDVAPMLALEAARRLASDTRPGSNLLDWFAHLPRDAEQPRWDDTTRRELFSLLRVGTARSWRFLETTGMLDRVLPELAETVRRRRDDASELDPAQVLRWTTVEQVHALAGHPRFQNLEHPDWVFLAALVLDVAGSNEPPVEAARQIVGRLGLGEEAEAEIVLLIDERGLLRAASARPDGLTEERVLPLALHLGRPERVRAMHLLTLAQNDLPTWHRDRLEELVERIGRLLAHADVTGPEARTLAEQRRAEAEQLATSAAVRERLAHAPRPWLLGLPSAALVRQASLLEPAPTGSMIRVVVTGPRVEIGCRDRRGLLAAVTDALTRARLTITEATTATWADGAVVLAFVVDGPDVDAHALTDRIRRSLAAPLAAEPVPDAVVEFDDEASPWYTIADVHATDRPGLLHAITAAIAAAGASIHSARVATDAGIAHDRFELTDRRGAKLSPSVQDAVRAALVTGVVPRRRPFAGRR
ncbi:MAG TPA: cation:proton antiporter [Acidimicrobiales bacterium]|nr:cation:proton antiporter [Acidimicrobiales bacterium]